MSRSENGSFIVVYRKSFTQSQVGPVERFSTKEKCEEAAWEFNRTSQDDTWNAVRAYVMDTREVLRT